LLYLLCPLDRPAGDVTPSALPANPAGFFIRSSCCQTIRLYCGAGSGPEDQDRQSPPPFSQRQNGWRVFSLRGRVQFSMGLIPLTYRRFLCDFLFIMSIMIVVYMLIRFGKLIGF
jgi:hypothetical protein